LHILKIRKKKRDGTGMRKRKLLEQLGKKVYEMRGLDRRLLAMKRSFDQVSGILKGPPEKSRRK
jgi:hypothetical protein